MSFHNILFQTGRKLTKVKLYIVLMCLLVSFSTNIAIAEDWPTYMHDNARSGASSESLVLDKLVQGWVYKSPVPPMRAWSDGMQWDAFAASDSVPMRDFDTAFFVTVVGQSVYFGSSVTNSLHCLNINNGSQRWFYRTYGAVRFPPSYYNGKLYFGSDDGYAYCINASDGSFVWKYSPGGSQRTIMNNGNLITQWPVRTGTAVLDGKVYFAASLVPWESTYLCSVSAATGSDSGANLYKTSGGIAPNGAILASSTKIYLPQGRYYPHVFNRNSGRSLGTVDGTAGVFALLTSDGTQTGLVAGPGRHDAAGSQLTGHSDRIASYQNGKCLVVADDTSYMITETSAVETTKGYKYNYVTKLQALDRTDGGSIKWQKDCDTRRFTVIYAGGTLFTGGVNKVQALNTADGSPLWSASVNGRVRGLTAANGYLFASTDTGRIYAFGGTGATPVKTEK